MLGFLLDIKEIPESHTGIALARAFQGMLEEFELRNKVCFMSCILYNVDYIVQNTNIYHSAARRHS